MIKQVIEEHMRTIEKMQETCLTDIQKFAAACKEALATGNKILLLGNGGSAADCQHMAAEIVGRFEKERRGLPAIALTTDTSILTAVANDYGFDQVFSRQVEALAVPGDVVIGISTSGNSLSVVNALTVARDRGAITCGLTGQNGGKMNGVCDICVRIPSAKTARIQEGHSLTIHIICQLIDET